MKTLEAILRGIDWFIEWSGQESKWLGLVLVFTISYDVVMRYLLNMPTKWSYELSYMVGGSMMVLAGAFVMLHDEHVRIDIIYNRLSLRKQLIIDQVNTFCSYHEQPLFVVLLPHGSHPY